MNWPNTNDSPAGFWLSEQPAQAKPHCCEEASLASGATYIPCNKPAMYIVGWKGRNDKPIRMCEMCADHNIKNRGGEMIGNYTSNTQAWTNPTSSNPWDALSNDELLLAWQGCKDAIERAKEAEMEIRKYIVSREFPKPKEGMNTKELGNGYQLKAGVKFNYNLADNDTVEATLDKLSNLGNAGSAIADRLVSWKPNFLLTEYRQLCEDKEKGSKFAVDALNIISDMLTITEAAPTLEIKEPRSKKK